MRAATAALAFLLLAQPMRGGAWTLDSGHFSALTGTIASTASRWYDGNGHTSRHIVFRKMMVQSWMEYGVSDSVTLFVAPEYVMAKSNMNRGVVEGTDSTSIEAGLRGLLLTRIGMLSAQVSAKAAGAFDMSVSSSGEAGHQLEARLLYGRSFKTFGCDGFFDVEVAERWISRPRPNEIAFEASTGVWVDKDDMVLLQSFNFMTHSRVVTPYQPYWLSKLQLSLVERLTRRWSFQSGYFISLAGRNIVKETGVVATLWFQA